MFSKALFKQSCKANGTMWAIITTAVCFMLACVMLISGNGSIGNAKNAIQDTIIKQEINSSLERRAINYYTTETDGLEKFDELFLKNLNESVIHSKKLSAWLEQAPNSTDYTVEEEYAAALAIWQKAKPRASTATEKVCSDNVESWLHQQPISADFDSQESYLSAVLAWKEQNPLAQQENTVVVAYSVACEELTEYMYVKALTIDSSYTKESTEAQELLGCVMYALNPNGLFNESYTENGEPIPEDYDVATLVSKFIAGDVDYIRSDDRKEYVGQRAEYCSSVFLAGNLVKTENVEKIVKELSSFAVTKEKYDSFGYTYSAMYEMSRNTVITYRGRYDFEKGVLDEKLSNGELTAESYQEAVGEMNSKLTGEITSSLLASLPQEVSEALEEIGQVDLYSLIVGSIFYKLAGLLLPIIYMIMSSNNLIAGQVDSGSMAYILSTSTKRKTVVFIQAVYLIGSLLAMFGCTTITGCICLACIEGVNLTYGKLLLLNLGAFLVLFALSGLCFLTSCWFDRSKKSMAIGGGLSIFALVAAMLGLFGSPVIPSVVRLDSLNFFNYATIISLFDVVSILDATTVFIWKFAVLLVLGFVGYVVGAVKFTKKDLPL